MPIPGQAGLRQRSRLGRAEPAAVARRRRRCRHGSTRRTRDLAPRLREVVGGAEAGHAPADDHDGAAVAHAGTPAVTCSSISRPSTANPVTRVVRAGGDGGKRSGRSCSRRRSRPRVGEVALDPEDMLEARAAASSTAATSSSTATAWASKSTRARLEAAGIDRGAAREEEEIAPADRVRHQRRAPSGAGPGQDD